MTLKHMAERLRALAKELSDVDRWLDHDACVLAADELDDIRLGRGFEEGEQDD